MSPKKMLRFKFQLNVNLSLFPNFTTFQLLLKYFFLSAICDIGCDNGGHCVGPNQCECPSGFQGSHCQLDVNECDLEPCGSESTCVNMPGWYYCDCRDGYRSYHNPLDGSHSCVDENECESDHTCHPDTQCRNTLGGYTCMCQPGAPCTGTCVLDGTHIQDGASWQEGCSMCVCVQGKVSCTQVECDCSESVDSRCCPRCQNQQSCSHQVSFTVLRGSK